MANILSLLTAAATVVLKLIIIIIAGLVIASVVAKVIRSSRKLDETAKGFFASFASLAIKILTVITALMALGIPAATFVTVLGSVGLAIGLAMQGALANFAGGILIVVFHPFRIGDHISVSGQTGVVQNISIFYTTILSDDNTVVTLPNGTLTNAPIVNTSVEDARRICLEFALPFDADSAAAKNAVLDIAGKNALVLNGSASAAVSSHVADKVTVKLTAFARSADYAKAVSELSDSIKAALPVSE